MGVTIQLILGLLSVLVTCIFAEAPPATPQPIQNVTEINNRDLNKIVKADPKTEILDPKDKSLIINHINDLDQFPIKLGNNDDIIGRHNESAPPPETHDKSQGASKYYWSSEFRGTNGHDDALPTSMVFEGTRHPSFDGNAELTTPTTALFDNKFKETVESVDQKLDNVDPVDDGERDENDRDGDGEEIITVEDLLRKAPENATVDFENTKIIVNNETVEKNSIHKDVNVEQTKKLSFERAFNETKAYEESEEGAKSENEEGDENDRFAVSAPDNVEISTRKTVILKESDEEKATLHLLSNKIETEFAAPAKGSTTTTVKLPASTTSTATPPSTILARSHVSHQENLIPLTLGTGKRQPSLDDVSSTTSIITTTLGESSTIFFNRVMSDATQSSEQEETTTTTITNDNQEVATSVSEGAAEDTTADNIRTSKSMIIAEEASKISEEPTTKEVEASTGVRSEFNSTTTTNNTKGEEDIGNSTKAMEEATTIEVEEQTTQTGLTETSSDFITEQTMIFNDSEATIKVVSTTELPETTLNTVLPVEHETSPVPRVDDSNSERENITTTPSSNATAEVTDLTSSIITTTTENNTDINPSDSFTRDSDGDNTGKIAAIAISAVGAVCLVILAGLLYVMKKRQKRLNYGPRCRPVNLDDYSIDNLSVYNSVRRKGGAARTSKRSFGNPAFDDPVAPSHPLNFAALVNFAGNHEDIKAEFNDVPQISANTSELPEGCDTKNRYANVIPLPETRVNLKFIDGYPNSDYINANYVTGPKNTKGYYIATQGPTHNTVDDFWRMAWEQQTKVILMLTHLVENGLEKCVDYLPESEVLECSRIFGEFQITLKKREVKEKYIISSLQLKNMVSNSWREVTHFWYLGWPEKGVPNEANSLIAFLIEARSYMKSSTIDKKDGLGIRNGGAHSEHSPVIVHCSPGTGRTGVSIACDIAIRDFETTRLVDIPKIVYRLRRDRASAVQTKEQYIFIYKVVSLYATKLTGGALENS